MNASELRRMFITWQTVYSDLAILLTPPADEVTKSLLAT